MPIINIGHKNNTGRVHAGGPNFNGKIRKDRTSHFGRPELPYSILNPSLRDYQPAKKGLPKRDSPIFVDTKIGTFPH